MSTFTRDDVQRLATLARLELSAEETEMFTRQLGDVLEFVRQIQAVDTSAAVPAPALDETLGVFREDVVLPSLDRTDVLAAAPEADASAGLFKVPRVLNG
jgi:aspartyl-tRNA(Asn)/glutamyl-tRNA(Gln) amidotransferase subunit C